MSERSSPNACPPGLQQAHASLAGLSEAQQSAADEAYGLFAEGIFTRDELERELARLKKDRLQEKEKPVSPRRPICNGSIQQAAHCLQISTTAAHDTRCPPDLSGVAASARNGHMKVWAKNVGSAKKATGSGRRPGALQRASKTCEGAFRSSASGPRASEPLEKGDSDAGWWVKGSEFLGRRVRRAVYDEETGEIVGAADGEIVGWLPLEVADFMSEFFNKPAALWHMVYDNVAVGEEDLEEFEVRDAIQSYIRDAWADLGSTDEKAERAARRHQCLQDNPQMSLPLEQFSPAFDGSSNEEDDLEEEVGVQEDEGRKRKREENDDENIRPRADKDGDFEGGCTEKIVDGKESKPAPKRHKEGIQGGVWRVTVCPKKPVNAYMMWFLENRQEIHQQSQGVNQAKISKIGSELWKAMPESVKEGYKRRSRQALDDFHRDVAAYKQYCAAQGIRPKFSCGGDGREVDKRCGARDRDALDEARSVGKSRRRKESTKGGRTKHPPVTPWFALVLESADADASYLLLQISSGVHSDGSCKAREWLRHGKVDDESASKGCLGVTKYVPASLYPQMMKLPILGWLPVMVSGDNREPGCADFEASAGSAADQASSVFILNEEQCVGEARRILQGELEHEPFPARQAPMPRLLGIQRPPSSPAEYVKRVEDLLLPDSADKYASFLTILRDFRSKAATGAARHLARKAALVQAGELFSDPPLDRLIAGFSVFLPEEEPQRDRLADAPAGTAGVQECSAHAPDEAGAAHAEGLSAEGKSILDELALHLGAAVSSANRFAGSSAVRTDDTCAAADPDAQGAGPVSRAHECEERRLGAHGGCPFLSGRQAGVLGTKQVAPLGDEMPQEARQRAAACKGDEADRVSVLPLPRSGSGAVASAGSKLGDCAGAGAGTRGAKAGPRAEAGEREECSARHDGGAGRKAPADDGAVTLEEEETVAQLRGAWFELRTILERDRCAPIMLRLAWHDASSFDKFSDKGWPLQGGANGSIRLIPELDYGTNKGLAVALSLLDPLLQRFDKVSAADLIQMAGAAAVEASGGPRIELRYGRRQADDGEHCSSEESSKRAATAVPPFPDGAASAAAHLRALFSRMGFSDAETVALMGAHTLGRAHRSRSGHGAAQTLYTKDCVAARPRGGSSWTRNWDTFDNSYFRELAAHKHDAHLLKLPTDLALIEDPVFRGHVTRFADDQDVFFAEYAAAHVRMSEAGALFEPSSGISVNLERSLPICARNDNEAV